MARGNIDLNNLPSLADIKAGPISALSKDSLVAIALALELFGTPSAAGALTVKELKLKIPPALSANTDPKFDKFKTFRAATTGKAVPKNSVDKAKEDSNEAAHNPNAPSGANKKLMERGAKTDPPPQFKRRGTTSLADGKTPLDERSFSSLSSMGDDEGEEQGKVPEIKKTPPPVVVPPPLQPQDQPVPPEPVRTIQDTLPLAKHFIPVLVQFRDAKLMETQIVYILPSQMSNIPLSKDANGQYFTSLKKLIPAALVGLSPSRDAPFCKLSVEKEDGILKLGTVRQCLRGEFPETLVLTHADQVMLRAEKDRLICEVKWTHVPAPTPVPEDGEPVAPVPKFQLPDEPFPPKEETGPRLPHFKPLEEAQGRKSKSRQKYVPEVDSDQEHDWPDNLKDPNFLTFLRTEWDIPGVGEGFKNSALQTVGEQKVRWDAHEVAIQICDNDWKNMGVKGSPYRVPERYKEHENPAYHQYAHRPFTKRDAGEAIGIKKGTVTLDREIFTSSDLAYDPLAERWVNGETDVSGEEPEQKGKILAAFKKFGKMCRKDWIEHLSDCKVKQEAKERAATKKESKVSRKRHRRRSSDSSSKNGKASDSEEEVIRRALKAHHAAKELGAEDSDEPGPSKKKKAKKQTVYDSDDLDTARF
ncbi:hypothetical protein R3P38DRAFT_3488337 [Favolaschia claudopus]|uniref:Uncharacterized protein n=1 Tax=Favolaschia claudopus TaxID=2862362 RepID=A0AAV9Z5R1_9AGAR